MPPVTPEGRQRSNEQGLKNLQKINSDHETKKAAYQKRKENTLRKRTLREELIVLLESNNYNERISTALIKKALKGDVKAFETIRDTIGEAPKQIIEADITNKVIKIELTDDKEDTAADDKAGTE